MAERDRAAEELGVVPATVVHQDLRYAPGFIHAIHPDHGEPVTYTPEQLLPDWLREALAAGARLVPEADGVFKLEDAPGRPVPRAGARPQAAKGSSR